MFGSKSVVRKNNSNLLKTSNFFRKMDTNAFSRKTIYKEQYQLNDYEEIEYNAITSESNSNETLDVINLSNKNGKTTTKNKVKKKKWYQEIGANIAETCGTVSDRVEGIVRNFDTKALLNTYKKEGATVATGVISVVEGAGKFGEAIVDFLATGGSIIDSVVINAAAEVFDREDWHEYAENLKKDTMAFVSTDHVGDTFDRFYDNTGFGKFLKENSYGFATTRAIGNGIGYTVGVIVTCVLTGGSAAPEIMALWGGIGGFGKGAQEAWSNGAGYWTGVGYATLTGGWEAFQFWAGGQINQFSKAGWSTAQNVAARVAMDTVDGAAEGFVQPALQAIYIDGYTDPNTGKYIEFDSNATIVDKYKGMWKEQGGWKTVGTNAAMAGIMSFAGETGEYAFRKGKVVQGLDEINKKLAKGEHFELDAEQLELIETARKQLGMSSDATSKEIVQNAMNVWKSLDFDKIDIKNMDLSTMKKLSDSIEGISDLTTKKEVLAGLTGLTEIKDLGCKTEFNETATNFIKNLTTEEATNLNQETKVVLMDVMREQLDDANIDKDIRFEQLFEKYRKTKFEDSVHLEQTNTISEINMDNIEKNVPDDIVMDTELNNDLSTNTNNEKNFVSTNVENIKSIGVLDEENSRVNAKIIYGNSNVSKASFKTMEQQAKIDFIKNGDLRVIENELDYTTFDDSLKSVLNQRIINSQDTIFNNLSSNSDSLFSSEYLAKYASTNVEIISSLSDENLVRLTANFSNGKIPNELIDEIMNRVNSGRVVFDVTCIGLGNPFTRDVTPDAGKAFVNAINQNKELSDKILILYKQNIQSIPKELMEGLDLNTKNVTQRLTLATMFGEGRIDETGLKILKSMQGNDSLINSFDFKMLDSDIISDLGEEFVIDVGRFSKLSTKLISLKENYPNLYQAYLAMVNNASIDNSLNTYRSNVQNSLEFLFNNSTTLDKNILNIDLNSLQEYILIEKNIGDEMIGFSNNFMSEFIKNTDLKAEKVIKNIEKNVDSDSFPKSLMEIYVTDLKKIYYEKYLGITSKEAKNLLEKYSTNLEYIEANSLNPDVKKYVEIIKLIDYIDKIDDPRLMVDSYNNLNIIINPEELLAIDECLRKEYVNTYMDALSKTSKAISESAYNIVKVDGKEIKVIELHDDFSMYVYSSDTGFIGDKKLINNNFKDTYLYTNDAKTHGISTSFITEGNMGSAPVGKNGVLYGYIDIVNSDVREMGVTDINSHIADFGFSSGDSQKFVIANDMNSETLRMYNETVLNRDTVKPSCIVLYSDASEDVVKNSYKAAADWDIPVIKIDVEEVAQKQMSKVNSLLESFSKTNNISDIEQALLTYESSLSGFNLNAIMEDGKFSNIHESVRQYYDSTQIEKVCFEYVEQIKKSGNKQAIDEFTEILMNIENKYQYLNDRKSEIVNTRASIDISSILKELMEYE